MADPIYPVWRYHPEKPAVLVHTAEQDETLGDGWGDSTVLGPATDMPAADGLSEPAGEVSPDAPKRRGRRPKA
jgi:hypothetical protein